VVEAVSGPAATQMGILGPSQVNISSGHWAHKWPKDFKNIFFLGIFGS